MKKSVFTIAMLFAIIFGNAQERITKKTIKSSTKNPDVTINVKKGYDKNGNLISIDSSYNYVYSTVKNDSVLEKDLYSKLKSNLNNSFYSMDSLLNSVNFMESPFKMNDFYTDEFFKNNFFKNNDVNEAVKKMDSLKNSFYQNYNKQFEDASKKKTFK